MKTNFFLSILAFILLSGLLLAATTTTTTGGSSTGPLIQITSYSTVPSTVYAGTTGYLQVSLSNNGAATASAAQALSTLDGVQNSVTIGDMAPGSSSVVVIPFHINPESAGGIQVVGVNINYYDNSGTSSSPSGSISKTASLYVPLQVAQTSPLVVNTQTIQTPTISAGEPARLDLVLINNGGVVNGLTITTPSNSTFSLDGTSQVVVGTIPSNSSQNLSLSLLSSTSTPVGTYAIPLTFTYYDRLNTPTVENLSVGPVHVQDISTQYRLSIDSSPVEVGSQATLRLTLSNTGSQPISAVVDVNSTDVLTPVGLQRIYFDSVPSGQSVSKDLVLGVSATAAPGYYTVPLRLTLSSGNSAQQFAGVAVQATPAVSITLDSTTSGSILIANTGNSQIHSVYATAVSKAQSSLPPVHNFIGTLNVDDYSTLDVSSMSGTVEVTVEFKDSQNQPHTTVQSVDITGVAGSGFTGARSGGFNASGGAGRGGAGGGFLGGLLGGGRGAGAGSANNGLPIVPIAIAIVVIALAAYLYYRHRKGKKKEAK